MTRCINKIPYTGINIKPIPFYDGYYLTDDYKIIGKTGYILSEIDTYKTGYKFVNVRVGKTNKILYLHRAVALVYVPGYFDGAFVDHIDSNPFNYTPNNLRWVTPSENIKYFKNSAGYKLSLVQTQIHKLKDKAQRLSDKIENLKLQENQLLVKLGKILNG